MIPQRGGATGRPRASSRQTLEEAAAELFLEQGYDGTTVDEIARRAGVGRATFFNYFPAKPDLLWVDVDVALDRLEDLLTRDEARGGGVGQVLDVLTAVAAELGPDRIPLAVTQAEIIGSRQELVNSGLARAARLALLLRAAVVRAIPDAPLVIAATTAHSIGGAVVAAWLTWAAAGVSRGELAGYLEPALAAARAGVDVVSNRGDR
jgi:AcrR family transcriptional regulator